MKRISLADYSLSPASREGRRVEKEIVRTGVFQQNGRWLRFDQDLIEHWNRQGQQMLSSGARIPVTLGHQGKQAGRVTGFEVRPAAQASGETALVARMELDDESLDSDTSIDSVDFYVDETGATYDWPITGVALTDRPVVQGLDGFRRVAASLDDDEDTNMNFASHFKNLFGKKDDQGVKKDDQGVKLAKDRRQRDLEDLVRDSRLSPAAATALAEIALQDDELKLALSHDGEDSRWAAIVAALAKNDPLPGGEESGPQDAIALDHEAETGYKPDLEAACDRVARE